MSAAVSEKTKESPSLIETISAAVPPLFLKTVFKRCL
jgi:hypothetical protein